MTKDIAGKMAISLAHTLIGDKPAQWSPTFRVCFVLELRGASLSRRAKLKPAIYAKL